MEPVPLKLLEPILTQRMEAHRRDAILWSPQTKKNNFVKPGNITPVFFMLVRFCLKKSKRNADHHFCAFLLFTFNMHGCSHHLEQIFDDEITQAISFFVIDIGR